jgi:hypothetical protein
MPRMGSRLQALRVRGGHESKAGAAWGTGMTSTRSLTPCESAASKAALPEEDVERVEVSFTPAVRHPGQCRGSVMGLELHGGDRRGRKEAHPIHRVENGFEK